MEVATEPPTEIGMGKPLTIHLPSDQVRARREERDADERRVPEMTTIPPPPAPTSSGGAPQSPAPRKRGGNIADKEHKRMKRLLRNRVSAQQARERKKVYLSDLEVRGQTLEQRNAELEEKVSTLQRENFMLRQIVKNTALKKNIGLGGNGESHGSHGL